MSLNSTKNRLPFIVVLIVALSFAMIAGAPADVFPDSISLPNGIQPEGIAAGPGTTFFVGSIATGAVYRGDVRTGKVEEAVPGGVGRVAIGLKYDARTGFLFVAGGPTGAAYVYDAATGATEAVIQLTTQTSFINDVIITDDAAYFTNSFQKEFYRVPLNDGQLTDPVTFQVIPLGGDFEFTAGAFNANGIAATPNGDTLIIVNSSNGALYNVDPDTGDATLIDLGGGSVPNGDGILLQGKTLYVVQNALNQVAVIKLNSDFTSGEIVETITSSLFRVPTTIARVAGSLYVVNARFGTPPTPDTDYDVVRVPD